MNSIITAILQWWSYFKSLVFADMHRMASGMSDVDLPRASAEKRAVSPKAYPLQFSLKRRQHLAWLRYVSRGSH